MKVYKTILNLFFIIVIAAIIFMSINSTLSCVDKNGCLRSWCKYDWLNLDYKLAIARNSKFCPFQQKVEFPIFSYNNTTAYLNVTDETSTTSSEI